MRAQDKTERQNVNVIQLAILILCLFVVRLGHTLEIKRRGQGGKQVLRAGPKSPAASFHCVREAARQSSWEVPRLVTGQCNLETGKILDRFHYLRSHIERWECCCRPQTEHRGQEQHQAVGKVLPPGKFTWELSIWALVSSGPWISQFSLFFSENLPCNVYLYIKAWDVKDQSINLN